MIKNICIPSLKKYLILRVTTCFSRETELLGSQTTVNSLIFRLRSDYANPLKSKSQTLVSGKVAPLGLSRLQVFPLFAQAGKRVDFFFLKRFDDYSLLALAREEDLRFQYRLECVLHLHHAWGVIFIVLQAALIYFIAR